MNYFCKNQNETQCGSTLLNNRNPTIRFLRGLIPNRLSFAYIEWVLYYTFTEFLEWYGGEIIHDPTYSAVAAMPAATTETSETSILNIWINSVPVLLFRY